MTFTDAVKAMVLGAIVRRKSHPEILYRCAEENALATIRWHRPDMEEGQWLNATLLAQDVFMFDWEFVQQTTRPYGKRNSNVTQSDQATTR